MCAMEIKEELLPINVRMPLKGLLEDYPQTQVNFAYQSFLSKFWIRNGVLEIAPKILRYDSLPSLPDSELFMHLTTYNFGNLPYLVALGKKRGFYWTGERWSCISPIYNTGSVNCSNASTVVVGVGTQWLTTLKRGDLISINGQSPIEIAKVTADTTLELVTNAPISGNGLAYKAWIAFIGQKWDSENYGGWLIFTNELDGMWKWSPEQQLQKIDVPYKPKFITSYKERLVGMSIIDEGYNAFNRVRWSNVGDINTWDSNSFADLIDTVGDITTYAHIGDDLFIFKEKSTIRCNYVGGFAVFTFPVAMEQFGTMKALSHNNIAYCWSPAGVYEFDGSRWPEEIGDAIKKRLKTIFDKNAFMLTLPMYDQILFMGNEDRLSFNFKEKAWGHFTDEPLVFNCGVLWKPLTVASWDSVGNAWNDSTIPGRVEYLPAWDEYAEVSSFDTLLLGNNTDGLLYTIKHRFPINSIFHTIDFQIDLEEHGIREARWLWFFIEGEIDVREAVIPPPAIIDIFYGTKHGTFFAHNMRIEYTFDQYGVFNWRFPIDTVGDFLRVCVVFEILNPEPPEHEEASFKIRQYGVQYIPSSLGELKK